MEYDHSMEAAPYVSPGWYSSPENKALIRYWDGEMWTSSTRPAGNSVNAIAEFGSPDHAVQHSDAVASQLREGEVIRLGYRSTSANTGRKSFVAATDERVFVVYCNYFRRSLIKRVESMEYAKIETVGTTDYSIVVTSGDQSMNVPSIGASGQNMVGWIRMQMDSYDGAVDIRALPGPSQPDAELAEANSPTESAAEPVPPLRAAQEIRELGKLYKDGLLTEEEFAELKQRLLGT